MAFFQNDSSDVTLLQAMQIVFGLTNVIADGYIAL